jgi:hypothetical protein
MGNGGDGHGQTMRTDLAFQFLRRGYAAIPASRPRGTDAEGFRARLLGRPALVVSGESGARPPFYDTSLTRRKGAVPHLLSDLLFGRGAVHGLDDDAHASRKQIFLDIVEEGSVDRLGSRVHEVLEKRGGPLGDRRQPLRVRPAGAAQTTRGDLDDHVGMSVVDGTGYKPEHELQG